jgi:DNA replication protein DnaC
MGYSGMGGRVSAANVPDDYRRYTLQTSPSRDNQSAAYRKVDAYVATFTRMFDADGERIKSLYLRSEAPGTGKTTTACAIINEWIIAHYIGSIKRNRQPLERPAYFLDVNAWQSSYNEFNRSRVPDHIAEPAAERYYNAQRYAMQAPFAVLDDVGVRDCTEGFRGDLHTVINERTANGMPTIYTSNVTIAELTSLYDARLADRISDMCVDIAFEGRSKRGMRK